MESARERGGGEHDEEGLFYLVLRTLGGKGDLELLSLGPTHVRSTLR